jgi:hypothetical protein
VIEGDRLAVLVHDEAHHGRRAAQRAELARELAGAVDRDQLVALDARALHGDRAGQHDEHAAVALAGLDEHLAGAQRDATAAALHARSARR